MPDINKSADTSKSVRRPIVGVGCVVFKNTQVLLVKRGREPRKGEWSLPGGKQEFGETLEETAIREVQEETGIVVEEVHILGVLDSFFPDSPGAEVERHYTLIDFWARIETGDPIAADDAEEAKFLPVGEALTLLKWEKTRDFIEIAAEEAGILWNEEE